MTKIKVKNDYSIYEEFGRQKAIIENQKKEIEFLRNELKATTKRMIEYVLKNEGKNNG